MVVIDMWLQPNGCYKNELKFCDREIKKKHRAFGKR